MTFWVGHMTQFTRDRSLFDSNMMLANMFCVLPSVSGLFPAKLYRRDYYDHLDISGCEWVSIGKSSTFDETGLWDAMVHATEICAMELCYVLHGTLGCFLMHSDKL